MAQLYRIQQSKHNCHQSTDPNQGILIAMTSADPRSTGMEHVQIDSSFASVSDVSASHIMNRVKLAKLPCHDFNLCRCQLQGGVACAEYQQLGTLLHRPIQSGYMVRGPATHGWPNWAAPPHHAACARRASHPTHQVYTTLHVICCYTVRPSSGAYTSLVYPRPPINHASQYG